MECIKLKIPYSFISRKATMTWQDIKYAIDNELVSPDIAIEHAMSELASLDNYPNSLLELASLSFSESVYFYINELIKFESYIQKEKIKEKWLYLTLSWLYENRHEYSDPLELIELVYADFDYPISIANFVRYMPTNEIGSQTEGMEQLYRNWKNYLLDNERKYKN